MALVSFGWSVPKVASSPQPHPEETVGSLTWLPRSHLSRCYFFQVGLQPQPTLCVLQLWPPPSAPQDRPKMLGWPRQPSTGDSSHPREQGSVGPRLDVAEKGEVAWWEATWAEPGQEGGRLWESTCAGGEPWPLAGPQRLMEASPTPVTTSGPWAHATCVVGQPFIRVRLRSCLPLAW